MTDMQEINENELQNEQGPIIPPVVLLSVAGLSLLIGVSVFLTQGAFGAIGYGALAVGLLALVLLVVLAPRQVADALTGRTLRFGGTSLLVTIIFLALLVTVYWFIQGQDWTFDLSETDNFSLNEEAAEVIRQMGVDPEVPEIELVGFYNATQLSQQEQTELLFEDYENTSGGKISYQFINPDRSPGVVQQYGVFPGDFVVRVAGTDDPESAEIVSGAQTTNQNTITNAILSVAASGDFRAYFLALPEAISPSNTDGTGIADISTSLTERLRWTVEEVSLLDLTSPDSPYALNDSAVDGDVLIVAGGDSTLDDDTVSFISDYLDGGGSLVMMALPEFGGATAASTESLNTYLSENFGLSFDTDVVVLDTTQAFNDPTLPGVTELSRQSFITTNNITQQDALVMPFTRTISVASDAPEGVSTVDLARSSAASYAKTGQDILDENFERNNDDPEGPFTVMASAENSETGARVVLVGSASMATDQFGTIPGIANQQVMFNALLWATGYDNFFETLPQVAPFDQRPQDTPVAADTNTLGTINFISLFALPFGVLLIGAAVWVFRREG